ncbi:heat shock 70 kDa protein 4-like [Oppia nitens]|uniref:heat shock 70 kDa protein 4-like n=1 Tax=Oppia nitens TaxID=1686743 RepID=UPI0023DB7892|nr:heat shock 70 kDa protein 4-like [Oppia nitens]
MVSTGPPTAAISAICGIDVGSENCFIAVARAGGIEILLNEYSQRTTPAYVGFGQNQRELGVSAKLKHLMNLSNTCYSPNRLIGKQLKEVADEFPYQLEQTGNDGQLSVHIWHNGEEHTFSSVQVLAMLLTKLKQVSGNAVDCVLNCPNYFTDAQRRSLMDAALIAGLNPIRIIPDTTAIALYYGFYRTAPTAQDSTIAAFVDCGHSSTQCSIVMYCHKENQMKVLAVEYEINCGGKHFDEILANHFIAEQKLKLNKRGRFRLIAECEKLKKQMSANSNDLPINVECLYEETDFSGRMDRTLFEQMSQHLFQKINDLFVRALNSANDKFNTDTGGKLGDFHVDVCEIVGGTSRIPAIKRMAKTIFGVEVTTTLNADEAVARGCALQCAILSPTFKVARQLQIIDFAPFQIDIRYWHQSDAGHEPECKVVRSLFPRGHPIPFTKQVSINCHSLPMIVAFDYVNESGQSVPVGEFKLYTTQTIQLNKSQLKLRIRLDPNGLVVVHSVSVVVDGQQTAGDKKNGNEIEDMETNDDNNKQQQNASSQQAMDTEDNNTAAGVDTKENNNKDSGDQKEVDQKKNKKPKSMAIELQVEPLWIRGKLNDNDVQLFKEIESNLILADKNWKEKTDAKNELEEYIYEWRDKMETGGYDPFIEDSDKQVFTSDLQAAEQWLYEQEDKDEVHSKSVYEERINKMKDAFTTGILNRKREFETRPSLMEQLGRHLQQSRKLIETSDDDEKETIARLSAEIDAKNKWFEESYAAFNAMKTTANPTITCDTIQQQINSIDATVRQLLNERTRKHEEKKRQAEAAAAKQTPPPPAAASKPTEQTASPSPPQQSSATPQQQQPNSSTDSPQMEVDSNDEIHPTI